MGYELAEQFGWIVPDVIIYPTGSGTGITWDIESLPGNGAISLN